jgi:hypothetical protein
VKKGRTTGAAIAGMLATTLAPAVGLAGKAVRSRPVLCVGVNDCKAKGVCSGATHGCRGQNACKGQGVTREKDAETCKAKGGKVAMAEKGK